MVSKFAFKSNLYRYSEGLEGGFSYSSSAYLPAAASGGIEYAAQSGSYEFSGYSGFTEAGLLHKLNPAGP
jgi:hypothetical protein